MRRIFILLLFIPVFLMALESEPSEVVGYVKYELETTSSLTNLNVIALPLDTEITNVTELANIIGVADQISVWNTTTQSWDASILLFGSWTPNTALSDNDIVLLSVTSDVDFYCAGSLPTPAQYSLVTTPTLTNLNTIMVPLNKSELTDADLVASSIGNVDQIAYWDVLSQSWIASVLLFGNWTPNFSVEIGTPLLVSVTSSTTWPARSQQSSNITLSTSGGSHE